jgi:hypothetical protein
LAQAGDLGDLSLGETCVGAGNAQLPAEQVGQAIRSAATYPRGASGRTTHRHTLQPTPLPASYPRLRQHRLISSA